MDTKKILGIIFSLVFVGAFAFVLVWGITNFNKVQEGISGTGLYSQEDLNNAYQDGYDTALTNKNEYDELINGYRDTITQQTDEISKLNSQITILKTNNKDYQTQVDNLTRKKTDLEEQVKNLTTIKTNNEETISSLNYQITELENEIAELEESNKDKDALISQKNTQINNLQNTISQLQRTNELNLETINNLNNQITSLNSQITDMTLQIQNNSTNVTALNNKIAELEKSVSYYEQYIANLESGEQVVATFEFDGSVYNIQVVSKNDIVSVSDPVSTDYVIFNYWTVDGVQIDLSTYQITANTKIVANVTYKYDVQYLVDNNVYDKQIVVKNGYATIPSAPTKTGYDFDGWTTNGVDVVNPNTNAITQNTVYVAKFTKLHTVSFVYEDEIFQTQIVRNNEFANNVSVENTNYKIFNGWRLNGVIVDLANQKIVSDTTFVADLTYGFDVIFMVDNTQYNSQIIELNHYVILPTNPVKEGYEFDGWTLNGVDIINPETISVTENTTYIAKFTQLFTVSFVVDDTVLSTQTIRSGNYAIVPTTPTKENYSFRGWSVDNENLVDVSTYQITDNVTFNSYFLQYGFYKAELQVPTSYFSGLQIWSDGENVYYSAGIYQYIFDKTTSTWVEKQWNGYTKIYGNNVWSDGTNIYYSDEDIQYVLDKGSSTWVEKVWYGGAYVEGYLIWTEGVNYYYSVQFSTGEYHHYKLDKSTSTWSEVTLSQTSCFGSNIWTDGTSYYCDYYDYDGTTLFIRHLVYNKLTSTWVDKTWYGYDYHCSLNMFSALGNNYCIDSSTDKIYVLNKTTSTWIDTGWYVPDGFSNMYFWSDGVNIYYTNGDEHYALLNK